MDLKKFFEVQVRFIFVGCKAKIGSASFPNRHLIKLKCRLDRLLLHTQDPVRRGHTTRLKSMALFTKILGAPKRHKSGEGVQNFSQVRNCLSSLIFLLQHLVVVAKGLIINYLKVLKHFLIYMRAIGRIIDQWKCFMLHRLQC